LINPDCNGAPADGFGGGDGGSRRRGKMSNDNGYRHPNKFGCQLGSAITLPLRVAYVKLNVMTFRIT
jgi:hypothetical protein